MSYECYPYSNKCKYIFTQSESTSDSAVPPAPVVTGFKKVPTSPALGEQMLMEAKITLADKETEDTTES